MARMSVGQFCLYLLIIIILKESLASAATSSSLRASPTTVERSGDTVTISWADVETPSEFDWLGIYTPPESTDDHFIGYVLLSSIPGWQSGAGSFAFPAVNMRAAYEFRLFRGVRPAEDTPVDEDRMPLPSSKERVAVSPTVAFANFDEPTQVHLSLTSHRAEMAVMFVTKTLVAGGAGMSVKYGRASDDLPFSAIATANTYRQEHMCHAPANTTLGWRDPGHIHLATMTALELGARYFYQVGSSKTGWSAIYSFVARDELGTETDALLFGDMGTYVPYRTFNWVQFESTNTMKWLERDLNTRLKDRPTFVSHIGDISYARGYSWLWDNFFTQIEPVAARAPWLVCIGNHEYDWPAQPWRPNWAPYGTDSGGECGVPYSIRFSMPTPQAQTPSPTGARAFPETRNLYYSIDFGVVHFVFFSTETDFLPGSEQYEWIVRDLGATDRRRTPFIVFQGHRPMYSTDNKAMSLAITRKMIEHLEPVLVEHKVSLALWGHVHKYERTCPLRNSTCMPLDRGVFPVHIVIGMGGQDWQPIDQPRPERPTAPIFPQPPWSLFRSFEFGFVRLHATSELMTVSYVGNHDGQVHDVTHIASPFEDSSATRRANPSIDRRRGLVSSSTASNHANSIAGAVPERAFAALRSLHHNIVAGFLLGVVFLGAVFKLRLIFAVGKQGRVSKAVIMD